MDMCCLIRQRKRRKVNEDKQIKSHRKKIRKQEREKWPNGRLTGARDQVTLAWLPGRTRGMCPASATRGHARSKHISSPPLSRPFAGTRSGAGGPCPDSGRTWRLITSVLASLSGCWGGGGTLLSFVPYACIFLVFCFLFLLLEKISLLS